MRKTRNEYLRVIGCLCVIAMILFIFMLATAEVNPVAYAATAEVVIPIEDMPDPMDILQRAQTVDVPPIEEPGVYYDIPLSHELQDFLREECEKRGIPIEYALAIMTVENTSFNPERVNSTNDYGLWQINIGNHNYIREHLGKDLDFTNPYDNIEAGVFWISRYYPRYGFEQAAMCYHHGEGHAKKLFKAGNTNDGYSQQVMAAMSLYL